MATPPPTDEPIDPDSSGLGDSSTPQDDTPQDPPSSDDDIRRRMSPDSPTSPLSSSSTPTGGIGTESDIRLSAVFDPKPNVQEANDPLLGTEIGGVRIISVIGQDGMGKVYEGQQQKPKRTVVVKVMRAGLATPEMRKRFEYETEILARLRHPGIAQIFSAGVESLLGVPVPYFVMEYFPDAKWLTTSADESGLSPQDRIKLFHRVCEAVAHCHEQQIVHRNLKPSHILVDRFGQPKLISFKFIRGDITLTTKDTLEISYIGASPYMEPEQITAAEDDIDPRCDVYALGVVLCELLSRRGPFGTRGNTLLEAMRIIMSEEPAPLSLLDKRLPRNITAIAAKCLQKERGLRYENATDLSADVGRHLAGDAVLARPPSFIDWVYRLACRN